MTEEYPVMPVEGVYARNDQGGVVLRFTRRTFLGVEPVKDQPGQAVTKEGIKLVVELWMTKESAFAMRGALNDILSNKKRGEPKAPAPPKDMNVG